MTHCLSKAKMFRCVLRPRFVSGTWRKYRCNRMMPVSHTIFDMDGTLLDTEKIYDSIFHEIAKEYGKKLTPELQAKVLGVNLLKTAQIMVNGLQLPLTPEQYVDKLEALGKERLENVELKPGVARLLCHFYEYNVPMALATSSPNNMIEMKTWKHHKALFDLFHHKVSGSSDPEVKRGKPAPDVFLVAAKRFRDDPDPRCCLVFEDAPNGIQGALSAGMQVVAIPEYELPQKDREMSQLVVKSLEDFDPELFGLPGFPEKDS